MGDRTNDSSNLRFIVFFTYMFLVLFSCIQLSLPNLTENKELLKAHVVATSLFIFYILPPFIEDLKQNKEKSSQSAVNFFPFLFLLPFYLGLWANGIIIIKLFYVLIACCISLKLNLKSVYRLVIAVSFALFILLFSSTAILTPLCILISVFLILQFKKENVSTFVLTLLSAIAIIKLLVACSPAFFNIFNGFSLFFSKASSIHIAGGSSLGLSLSGYELFFVLFTVTVVFVYLTKNIRYTYSLLIFIFVYSLYLQVFPVLLAHYPPLALNTRFILPLALCIILFLNEKYFIPKETAVESKKSLTFKHTMLFSSVAFILLLFVFFKPLFISKSDEQKRIAIVSKSKEVADLTPVSNVNRIGFAYSPYTYGSIQMYLELFGYKTQVFYGIENVPMQDFDCLLLIHYNAVPNDTLKEKVKKFTSKGGSVFAVSDHTNIFNSMQGTNELLRFSSLKINDDISDSIMHYSGKVWQNSLDCFYSFTTQHIKNENDIGVWGGASVSSQNIFSEPMVIAKYGLSDPGDHSEIGKANSFMRNRKFDIGEQAGDIPLIFKTSFGNGNVIFLGDASYFQVPVLMHNWNFIAKLFYENLYSKNSSFKYILNRLQIIIILLLLGFVIFINKKYAIESFNKYVLVSLILAAFIMFEFNTIHYSNTEKVMYKKFSRNFLAIDCSHENFYSVDMLAKNDISGLGYNAMKLQIPVICTNNKFLLTAGKAIAIINPRTPITKIEADSLNEYMKNGNSVLLFCGKEFDEYCKSLLKEYGLSFSKVFLGPLPWKFIGVEETDNIIGPEFKEAWNILYEENTNPYYSYEGMVPVTKTMIGAGALYFIADSRFISADNIEGEMNGNKQNIEFIQSIFTEIFKDEVNYEFYY